MLWHTFRDRHGSQENALFFLALTSEVVATGAMPCKDNQLVIFLSVVLGVEKVVFYSGVV